MVTCFVFVSLKDIVFKCKVVQSSDVLLYKKKERKKEKDRKKFQGRVTDIFQTNQSID